MIKLKNLLVEGKDYSRLSKVIDNVDLHDMLKWIETDLSDVDTDDLDPMTTKDIVQYIDLNYPGGLSGWNKNKKIAMGLNEKNASTETMKKIFENIGNNIFKLKEISINIDSQPEPDPDPFNRKRFDKPKQIGPDPYRMMKPKGRELRKEKYMRIASNVDQAEFEEMCNYLTDATYEDALKLGKDDSRDEIYQQVKEAERWEIIQAIEHMYNGPEDKGGLAKWKKDHNSPWDL